MDVDGLTALRRAAPPASPSIIELIRYPWVPVFGSGGFLVWDKKESASDVGMGAWMWMDPDGVCYIIRLLDSRNV